MKEIITFHVGQCANQIGAKFWENICEEHHVTDVGYFEGELFELMGINTHFSETQGRRYVPRAVMIDLDPITLDTTRCSKYGQIFNPEHFIFGRAGSGNNWGTGNNTQGEEIANYALEATRQQVENCESLSAFNVIHGLAGGTGSGVTSLMLEKLTDEYHKKTLTTYSVYPLDKVSEKTVQAYNTVLTFPSLIKYCNMNVGFDNEALYLICQNKMAINNPSFGDINAIISEVLCGMSCCMRFPGTANSSLRKQHYTMCPYPDVHFFLPGYAPLNSRGVQPYRTLSLEDIIYQIFSEKTILSSADLKLGKYLTTHTIIRGQFSEFLLENLVVELQRNNKNRFVPWLDCHCSYGVCSIPTVGTKIAATYLANHSGITRMWRNIQGTHRKMFQRKAFLHWYIEQNVSETDFIEADEEFTKLIEKYEFLENLPAIGGCVNELGDEEVGCDQPPCIDEIADCGLDAIRCEGELGPICVDRSLFCGCKNGYCCCTDNLQVFYRVEDAEPIVPLLEENCTIGFKI